jgi:hypothetical protein
MGKHLQILKQINQTAETLLDFCKKTGSHPQKLWENWDKTGNKKISEKKLKESFKAILRSPSWKELIAEYPTFCHHLLNQNLLLPQETQPYLENLQKENPSRFAEVLQTWITTTAHLHTGTPRSKNVDHFILHKTKESIQQPDLKKTLSFAIQIFKTCTHWKQTNKETPKNRLEAFLKSEPEFDPQNPDWQTLFARNLKSKAISLYIPTENKGEEVHSEILIIGETHSKKETPTAEIELLKTFKKHGFLHVGIEEPSNSKWDSVWEFEKILKAKDITDKKLHEIPALAYQFTKEITSANRISLLCAARLLHLQIILTDADTELRNKWRKEQNEEQNNAITNGIPFDLNNPISVLGGEKAFATSILSSYQMCKKRSEVIAKTLIKKNCRIIQFVGKLHVFDIQDKIGEKTGKRPTGILLEYNQDPQPIIELLGKTNPQNSKFSISVKPNELQKAEKFFTELNPPKEKNEPTLFI